MRRKLLLGGILLSLLLVICPNVMAESYYSNNNGVAMSESEYNKMVEIYGARHTAYLTQEEFDYYKDKTIVDSGTVYVKENYINDVLVSEEEISEEEYNLSSDNDDSNEQTRYGSSASHTTNYKKLTANLVSLGNLNYSLVSHLEWKKVPAVKSYDVFAFYLQHFSYSGVTGSQYAYTSSGQYTYSYNSGSAGYKGLSSGAGISMNLKDGSNITGYDMFISATLHGDGSSFGHGNALVSYQHAKVNLTRAQSMSYSLGPTGLGGVIIFSSGVMSSYDGMAGVGVSGYF